MATDKSEPKIGAILKVAAFAIVSLLIIRQGLITYFHHWEDTLKSEAGNPVNGFQDLTAVRSNEKSLTSSPMSISSAMQMMVASKDPMRGDMASGSVKPLHPSDGGPDDMRAVTDCWSKMPCDGGGLAAPPVDQTTTASDGGASSDGGTITSDGGAADGGKRPAPHAPPGNPGNPSNPGPNNPPNVHP